ncbi:MAG: Rne/Rng family ribonuclease [Acidobacteriales bacterium]|nr:Rne/Rng family ribonuclease [Terriglobales bacterium]
MNKELYVSSTPHETKVGIVEDDQLAEIYLELENEYTLAGSIYKGRVTRVLPGMQSAFVDIGLERDAFLYVSDFMDLEQQDEDLDEAIPAGRPPEGRSQRTPEPAMPAMEVRTSGAVEAESQTEDGGIEAVSSEASSSGGDWVRDPRGFRGRRRRRGRRPERPERGERGGERGERDRNGSEPRPESRPETRFQRPPAQDARSGRDYDYGPPPGYQPILLPGESISKYRRQAQGSVAPAEAPAQERSSPATVAGRFPDDEPMFAAGEAEPLREQHEHVSAAEGYDEPQGIVSSAASEVVELETGASETALPEIAHEADFRAAIQVPTADHIEEQEIEEEEADLDSYAEELEEDAAFEELEEETRAAGESTSTVSLQEPAAEPVAEGLSAEPAEAAEGASEAVLEEEEMEAEELELEEAQEEAEALLEAEAIGAGTVDASAEVRSSAPEARLQRAPRPAPGFDRRRGRRGGRRFHRRENTVVPQISELLKEGQEILVQIAKEPIGKKGARITSHIALPGRFLVYMPTVNHTGVSRKIASEEERLRLKRIIHSERENGHGGFIVRTAAQGASDEELRADIRFLKNLWTEIKSRSDSSKPPALIYHDLNVVERVLRDQVTSDFSVIWVDTETEYERILRFANRFQPALVKRVKLYTKETPLYEQFGLNEELNKALKSKVWLKSGGYIVINQTEALVAIDVNTGKYVGKTARLEDTIVKTNVDAIREIVRQIRLRDLGGIIVIDFIDMDERRNRQKVMQALEEALRLDRAPSKALQFNDFGLVAITRKRVKQSLERTIGSPCPYCQATGFVKSVNTVCNEVYVEMRKISKHLEHSDVMLRVNPEVAKALKANNARLLNEMEELVKKTIIVKSDPALHQEQFDIH